MARLLQLQSLPLPLLLALICGKVTVARAQCSPASSAPDPRIGVVIRPDTAGTACYFPFAYGSSSFDDCDGSYCDGDFCGYWCATSCNYEADYAAWRFCKFLRADLTKPNCSGLTNISAAPEIEVYGGVGAGAACYFPFLYNNVCYDDCIVTVPGGDPWCATTDVMYHVSDNQRFCRATRKGLQNPSCANLSSAAPVHLPRQTGNYSIALTQSDPAGNCTFPFYYKEKCYNDCTTVDAQAWNLPWCPTEKYYLPNKKMRVCPHYRQYKDIGGLALEWGFFYVRQLDSNASLWWHADSTAPMLTPAGSPRVTLSSLSSAAEPVELMPQPNGFFILKLAQNCSATWNSVSLDENSDVGVRSISVEREFWDIRASGGLGAFTVQSTRNSTRGMYLSYKALGAKLVLSLSSINVSYWRFEKLPDIAMATLRYPCENPVTLNGSWCAWSDFTPSGNGMAVRNRSCACPPQMGGLPCEGNGTEVVPMVNGSWCEWSAYGFEAGGSIGFRSRQCNCTAPNFGGLNCAGAGNETGRVVNGSWCEWSAYRVGGDSFGRRTRDCNCSTPAFGGSDCTGSWNESGPAVRGSWCEWSAYSVSGGYGSRSRQCNCSAPAFGGAECQGAGNETGALVNGSWCDWSPFSSIGGTRTRACNCSSPQYGGAACPGTSSEMGVAVSGTWCPWSAYSGNGTHETRRRACNCTAPAYGGADCPGENVQAMVITAGGWCAWSAWTASGTTASVKRNRTCNCPSPSNLGADCGGGSATETANCTTAAGCVSIALPQEPGEPGASISSMSAYKRLASWAGIITASMLVCMAVGVCFMLRKQQQLQP